MHTKGALDQLLAAALGAEGGDDDLIPLAMGVKRKHMHWTHIRTHNPQHVQPSSMTRQDAGMYDTQGIYFVHGA